MFARTFGRTFIMRSGKAFAAFSVSAVLLSGCVPPTPPYQITAPFSEADFKPWDGSGPATLQGQAFLKTVGGDVKTCAGEKVSLMPATAYNREIVNALRAGREHMANRSASGDKYVLDTQCDAQGHFAFANVQAREWFVWTSVTWGVPTGNSYYPIETEGGRLIKQVNLKPGLNSAIVSSADESP
jgi:hypothetical protein